MDHNEIAAAIARARPWYTDDAVAWLDVNLAPSDFVFEIGGGASTGYFLSRCAGVTTLETSPDWASCLLGALMSDPDQFKRWALLHLPVDWTPTWRHWNVGYWGARNTEIDERTGRNLEERYLAAALSQRNCNVLSLDGGLRSHLMILFHEQDFWRHFDIVIIDNTEFRFAAYWTNQHPLRGFSRLDFVAGPKDTPTPEQKGKHVTTIFVRDGSGRGTVPCHTHSPIRWTGEELSAHQHAYRSPEDMRAAQSWEATIRRELAACRIAPPES